MFSYFCLKDRLFLLLVKTALIALCESVCCFESDIVKKQFSFILFINKEKQIIIFINGACFSRRGRKTK